MTIPADFGSAALERLDGFHALLPALARGLDVREIFQHLSTIASVVLPHDEADLLLLTDDGLGGPTTELRDWCA